MTLKIKILTLGIVATNAYIIGDEDTRRAVLIDPVDDAPTLLKAAEDSGWSIALILATHAHFDHVLASADLKAATGAPFAIHPDAAATLPDIPERGRLFYGKLFPAAAEPDRLLTTESEIIEVDGIRLETLYTPGHAPGHIAFYMRDYDIVFSGDALFNGGIGRTDLPGSNHAQLMQSIHTRLLTLPDDTRVLSGHGDPTTIGHERAYNPFLRQ
jgi:hydroxyacylglutathione hydrolase